MVNRPRFPNVRIPLMDLLINNFSIMSIAGTADPSSGVVVLKTTISAR